jgi:single-strand DNA-binding protein
LQTRSWDDKDTGAKRYKTEVNANDVQFLDSQRDGAAAQGGVGDAGAAAPVRGGAGPADGGGDIDPDDIPF